MKIIKLSVCVFMSIHLINARQDSQSAHAAQDFVKQEALHAAILNDSAQQVQDALKDGANPNKEIEPYVRRGIKMPLKRQSTPIQSPLYLALIMKHQNAIQALLDGGAKPDEQLIQKGLEIGSFGNVLSFLKKNPPISEQKIDDFMGLCITNGLNKPANQQSTAQAATNDQTVLEIIQQLINLGYNINDIWFTQTGGGSPNFYWSDDALKLFLKNGANPNFIYIDGAYSNTPLLQAIAYTREGRASLSGIKILLDAGANMDQMANPYGQEFGGTNPFAPSGQGTGAITPLEFATQRDLFSASLLRREKKRRAVEKAEPLKPAIPAQ